MCDNCEDSMLDIVATDRGNFIVLTDLVAGSPVEHNVIPGIAYLTTITPTGLMRPKDWYDALMMIKRYGQSFEGCSACIEPSYDKEGAKAAHDRAIMLATTHDFTWMSIDKQHEIIYGFSSIEGIPTE